MPSKDRTQVCYVLDKRSPHCTLLLRPLGSTSGTIVSNTHPTAPHFWGPCGAAEWLDLKDRARPHHALFLREAAAWLPQCGVGCPGPGAQDEVTFSPVRTAGRPSQLPPAPGSSPLAPRAASIAAGTPLPPVLHPASWALGSGPRSVPAGEPGPRCSGKPVVGQLRPLTQTPPQRKTVAPGKARGGAPRRRKGRGQRPGCRKRPRASERR